MVSSLPAAAIAPGALPHLVMSPGLRAGLHVAAQVARHTLPPGVDAAQVVRILATVVLAHCAADATAGDLVWQLTEPAQELL